MSDAVDRLTALLTEARAEVARLTELSERAEASLRELLAYDEWARTEGGVAPQHLIGVWERARALAHPTEKADG
jgi:hypothetical protein